MQLRAAGTYAGSVSVVVSLEPGGARPYPGLARGYSGVLEKEKLPLNAASGRVTLSTLLERWNVPVQWLKSLPSADIWRNRALVGGSELCGLRPRSPQAYRQRWAIEDVFACCTSKACVWWAARGPPFHILHPQAEEQRHHFRRRSSSASSEGSAPGPVARG